MDLAAIDPQLGDEDGDDRYHIRVVVETPRGSRHKFAWEPGIGALTLRQTLPSGLSWPYDYGFIPRTLGDDGDPLDILVLMDAGTVAGCTMQIKLLGGFDVYKNGTSNPRFLGALLPLKEVSLSTDGYERLRDLPSALLGELETFLRLYSEERGNKIDVRGRLGRKESLRRIRDGNERWCRERCSHSS